MLNLEQQVRVIRSISDVVDSTRANLSLFREKQQQQKQPGILKSTRLVRNHQRRVMFLQPEEPEVEEQEEEELEEDGSVGSSSSDDSPFNKRGHKTFLRGSFERMPIHQDSSGSRGSGLSSSSLRLNAANCSNHRSVTRPRDVKFKKNNKCSTSWKPSPVDGHGCSPTATTIVTASGNLEFQTSFSHQVWDKTMEAETEKQVKRPLIPLAFCVIVARKRRSRRRHSHHVWPRWNANKIPYDIGHQVFFKRKTEIKQAHWIAISRFESGYTWYFSCVRCVNIVDDLAAKTRKCFVFCFKFGKMCRPLHFARREFHKEQSKKSFIG